MRADNLISFLSILLEKHDMAPCRCAKVPGVVVGIPRPRESVIRHVIPFFARDFTGFAADANSRIGEKSDLDVIVHIGMFPLIGALESFTDHRASYLIGESWP